MADEGIKQRLVSKDIEEVVKPRPISPSINIGKNTYQFKDHIKELDPSSMNIDELLLLNSVEEKLEEIEIISPTKKKQIKWSLYKKMEWVRKICWIMIFCMMFIQRPVWCTLDKYSQDCQYPIDHNEDENYLIPVGPIPFINDTVYYSIEIIILIFMIYNRILRGQTYDDKMAAEGNHRVYRNVVVFLGVITIINDILLLCFPFTITFNVGLFAKPLFFIFFTRSVRKTIATYIRIMCKGWPLLAMMMLNIFFFTQLGKIIFYDTPGTDNYFQDFYEGYFQLLVLMTTCNYPDVMMTYYRWNRWSPLFFMSFLFIQYILLLNMIIGVFYTYYKEALEQKAELIIHQKAPEKIVQSLELYRKSKDKSIDPDTEGKLIEFIQLLADKQKKKKTNRFKNKFIDGNPQDPTEKAIHKVMITDAFELFMGLVAFSNFCILFFEVKEFDQHEHIMRWNIVNQALNSLFLLEEFVKMWLMGPRHFFTQGSIYIFEFLLTSCILIFTIVYACTKTYIWLSIVHYLIILRIIRFLISLNRIQNIYIIYDSIYKIMSYPIELFANMMFLFFFFSALGQHIFGGRLSQQLWNDLDAQALPGIYIYNNFNDMYQGIVLLYELIIVNNWQVNVGVQQYAMGNSIWYRTFFVAFYLITVVLSLNITTAIIIEHIVNQWHTQKLEKKEEDALTQQSEEERRNTDDLIRDPINKGSDIYNEDNNKNGK